MVPPATALSSTFDPALVAPGALVAGKYRVERTIGEGGMGVVLAAHHVALDQKVALKVLHPRALDRSDGVERFLREARSAVRLRSQHVAKVFDVGTLDGGVPYMVLEYLEGMDLDAIVRSQGALPAARAVTLIIQACEAVAEAHALGIVHRDLKPHNLFVTRGVGGSDLLKVLDFGIAKSLAGVVGGEITKTDTSVGSPLYMSPEQMRSPRDVDPRTDIWSLGVTLYEILAGRPPFDADSFPELVLKVSEGRWVPLRQVCPSAPPGLAEIVQTCLAREPAGRYPDVAHLATALEPFAGAEGRVPAENARRALASTGPNALAPVTTPGSNPAPFSGPSSGSPSGHQPVSPAGLASDHLIPTAVTHPRSGPNAWSETMPASAVDKIVRPGAPRTVLIGAVIGTAVIAAGTSWFLASRQNRVDVPTAPATASIVAAPVVPVVPVVGAQTIAPPQPLEPTADAGAARPATRTTAPGPSPKAKPKPKPVADDLPSER